MKSKIVRIAVSAALLAGGMFTREAGGWASVALFAAAYIVAGYDVIFEAVKNIFKGELFDENFLMGAATIGAFCIKEYPEAVAVMMFFQIGELLQERAVEKSRRSIERLMDIRPDAAFVKRDGKLLEVNPGEVKVGEFIVVKPGERVPLDGVVTEGDSYLDTSALTGESVPRHIAAGDRALSGCINTSGVVTVKVEKEFAESTASRILDLIENASEKKSRSENFITRFAKVYTPCVVAAAVLIAAIPPIFFNGEFSAWLYRALTFLMVSCPCALVLSVPLGFFAGIGGASKRGILVKGGNYLEMLSRAEIAAFDKTGTLTQGVFEVNEILPADGFSDKQILEYAAAAESFSTHPIAQSIERAYGKKADSSHIESISELSGRGVRVVSYGKTVIAGNLKLMREFGVDAPEAPRAGTVVYVAVDAVYAGLIIISDKLKPDAKRAIETLKSEGVKKTVMLTGDSQAAADAVAAELGVDECRGALMPADKVEAVEEMIKEKSKNGAVIFAGDGINDAPVLALADVGVAMGALGSDAAVEAADVVIMTDEPSKTALAVKIARRTMSIVRQNVVFALAVKLAVLILSALGISSMWEAVVADVGVSLLAVLNSLRALNVPEE